MGSSAKKQKPTDAEHAEAQIAASEFNNWVTNYVPLERQAVSEVLDPLQVQGDQTLLRSRANADAAQVGGELTRQTAGVDIAQGRQGAAMTEAVDVASNNKASALTTASQTGVENQIARSLNAIRKGRDLAGERNAGLRQQAAQEDAKLRSDAGIRMQENATKMANISKLASSAATTAYMRRQESQAKSAVDRSALQRQSLQTLINAPSVDEEMAPNGYR